MAGLFGCRRRGRHGSIETIFSGTTIAIDAGRGRGLERGVIDLICGEEMSCAVVHL